MSTHSSISAEARKAPEVLEQEIDQQRNHIDALIDAVELRLKPQRLIDQALAYGREHGGLEMAERLGQTLKSNPIPLALTAVGLAWLAVEQTRSQAPAAATPSDDHETLAEALEQAKRSLDQGGSDARQTLQELAARAERLSRGVKQQVSQVDDALHRKPWAFAAAGLAIGAAVGLLSALKRTDSPRPGDAYDLADSDDDEADKPPFRPGAV